MPGIPSKDASFVWGTPRNYALTKVLILDEYRGQLSYENFLGIFDVYSRRQQHCRYENTYALWTQVLICTVLAPEEVYHNMVDTSCRNSDTFEQMMRRLDVIVYHYKYKGEYKTYEVLASEYPGKDRMIEQAMSLQKFQDDIECAKKKNELEKRQYTDEQFMKLFGSDKTDKK